jgi:hypothetical protein
MSKTARSMVAIPVAVILVGLPGLPLSAMAQQPTDQPSPKKPAVRGQPIGRQNPSGQPPRAGGGPAPAAQVHASGPLGGEPGLAQPAPFDGLGQPAPVHAVRAVGERGYSFRGADHGRRDVATFNERERAVWFGSHWRHERRFGRLGYWWEVNGVWYFYDQPMAGPPTYVSEVEFMDKVLDRSGPVVVGQPAPVVAAVAPPVVDVARPALAPRSQCPTGSKSYPKSVSSAINAGRF